MIARQITDIRTFMSQFLMQDIYDSYMLCEGSITTYCTFSIDGAFRNDFFDAESESAPTVPYVYWHDVRDYCFSLIKGKQTPLHFKFVLQLDREHVKFFLSQNNIPFSLDDIYGLYINFQFDGTSLLCTTGTSLRAFSLDKTLDNAWDLYVLQLLQNNGIALTQLD